MKLRASHCEATSVNNRCKVILEEGCTVPAEARLICAYDDPDGFRRYKEQQTSFEDNASSEKSDEDSTHRKEEAWGSSIVAIDQSAMTGESLAVPCSELYLTSDCSYELTPSNRLISIWAKFAIILLVANEAKHTQLWSPVRNIPLSERQPRWFKGPRIKDILKRS